MNDLPPIIDHAPLLPSARVHRVFHRIGVVVGGVFMVASVVLIFTAIWGAAFNSPRHYAKLSEIPFYDLPDIGDTPWVKYGGDLDTVEVVSTGYPRKMVTASTFLREYNNRQTASFWANVWSNLWIAAICAGIAIFLYAALRAVGWIVAGAFKF